MADAVSTPMSGGAGDPGLVIAVLAGGAVLCADCLAKKAGIPIAELPGVMARVSLTLRLQTREASCSVCLATRKVYLLG